MKQIVFFVFLGLFVCLPVRLPAQWSDNSNVNTPIVTAKGFQFNQTSVTDGAGGAIITWQDYRGGGSYDIYAQRINAAGIVQWAADGVVISVAANDQLYPAIAVDGAGGAIIAWSDGRGPGLGKDIYAQRVNAAGVMQWTANGVAISTAANDQINPAIVGDGAGGAIITWQDTRTDPAFDIFAQRVNGAGAVQWAANGVAISTAANDQNLPAIVTDGAAGAIIAWQDYRGGSFDDVYAQRINAAGTVQWTANGVAISIAAFYQDVPHLVSDGAGGAIITWQDLRGGSEYDIYAQRINAAGAVQWTGDGVAVTAAAGNQYTTAIATDGTGGAIIAWQDYRSGLQSDIYAQRISASGVTLWVGNGVAISTTPASKNNPAIVSDGAGGAVITFEDAPGGYYHISAQRINTSGVVQWAANGLAVSTAAGDQRQPVIISDGSAGAIITWYDSRAGSFTDIYTQNITGIGLLGNGSVKIQAVKDVKNDQGGKVNVYWNASPYDIHGDINPIVFYSVFRGMRPSSTSAGAAAFTPSQYLSMKKERALTSNDYMKGPSSTSAADTIYWQWIDDVTARKLGNYVYAVPTLADSTPLGTSREYFMVGSTLYNLDSWLSAPDSGYSVDNLAPIPPVGLAATVLSGPQVKLTWSPPADPDVKSYAVYRSAASGFTPGPATSVGSSASTNFTDALLPSGAIFYYKIVATDVHDNSSLPSAEVAAPISATQQFGVQDKWNMVSVPLVVSDFTKTALFPTASTSAFAYDLGYTAYGILENGRGYWLKFPAGQSVSMTGMAHTVDTMSVNAGWNMVGSLSSSIPIANVGSIPGAIVAGNFYGYNNAYQVSPTIEPGKAYWIKVSQAGQLVMHAGAAASPSTRIRIEDTGEKPPAPPEGAISGEAGVPNEFALAQNYPNPFNPATVINYSLPATEHVTLIVYNMLGQVMATLVDMTQDAGYRSVSLDASRFPSGMYTYKLTAGSFTAVKKMALIK